MSKRLQVDSLAVGKPSRQPSSQLSIDPQNDLNIQMDHYIGIDVGTGSARACIIDSKGDIIGLASESIGLWQPEHGYYVRSLKSFSSLSLAPSRHIDLINSRNNLPTTSGKPFAYHFSESWPSTTSILTRSGALVSMPLVPLRSSPMIQMSLFL